MDTGSQRILLLGGYGRAGKQVSKLVIHYSNAHITIAGRTLCKAEEWASSLNQISQTKRATALKLDISNHNKLLKILKDFDLLVVSVPYPENSKEIIKTIIETGTDYIDIVPEPSKNKYFEWYNSEIRTKGMTCILEAGWEPGLPALLIHLANQKIEGKMQDVEVHSVYRDRAMPTGSIADIMTHASYKQRFYKDREWKAASMLNTTTMSLPEPFGNVRGYPTELEELLTLPKKLNIDSLILYQGGYNILSDLILFIWMLLDLRRGSFLFNAGAHVFQWANKTFTTPESGGVIKVMATGEEESVTVTASTMDLYRATAVTVVATILLLDHGAVTPGIGFMGHKLPPKKTAVLLRKMGISLSSGTK